MRGENWWSLEGAQNWAIKVWNNGLYERSKGANQIRAVEDNNDNYRRRLDMEMQKREIGTIQLSDKTKQLPKEIKNEMQIRDIQKWNEWNGMESSMWKGVLILVDHSAQGDPN